MTNDQVALDLINEWESQEYQNKTQQKAALQCLIIEALNKTEIEEAKQSLFKVGKEINEDTRIAKKAKSIAVAHILNELSDLQKDNSL